MGSAVTGRLRELAEKATPGRFYQDEDMQAYFGTQAWEELQRRLTPEVVLALCDVADAAERVEELRFLRSKRRTGRSGVAALALAERDLREALARLSVAEEPSVAQRRTFYDGPYEREEGSPVTTKENE